MAYTAALKAAAPKGACGFDPHPGHERLHLPGQDLGGAAPFHDGAAHDADAAVLTLLARSVVRDLDRPQGLAATRAWMTTSELPLCRGPSGGLDARTPPREPVVRSTGALVTGGTVPQRTELGDIGEPHHASAVPTVLSLLHARIILRPGLDESGFEARGIGYGDKPCLPIGRRSALPLV